MMTTIAVIDDSEHFRELMRVILEENAGYTVETFINGVEFLNSGDYTKYDLLILDFDMPLLTGDNLFRKMAEVGALEDIPVLILSGVADESFMDRFGAWEYRETILSVDFIHKSFTTGWLLFRIDNLLKLRRLHLENRVLRKNAPSLS